MTAAETFLTAWHARHAGASSLVFGAGRTEDGRDSYDRLADHAVGAHRILDLACGDGTLLARARAVAPQAERIGVDLSPDELANARRADPAATLHLARAQALPLPDDHVDCVLSHMALMLMDEVDQVVAELSRVVRPGGRVAIVVGVGINDALRAVLARGAQGGRPEPRLPRIGDPRTRSADGLRALLRPVGPVEIEAFTLRQEVANADLPAFLSHAVYETDAMQPASRSAALAEAPDPLPVAFDMLLASVQTAEATGT